MDHLITTSVPRAMFTHFLVEHRLSQYYLYIRVELYNLMIISNPLTFRVKTFQLSKLCIGSRKENRGKKDGAWF